MAFRSLDHIQAPKGTNRLSRMLAGAALLALVPVAASAQDLGELRGLRGVAVDQTQAASRTDAGTDPATTGSVQEDAFDLPVWAVWDDEAEPAPPARSVSEDDEDTAPLGLRTGTADGFDDEQPARIPAADSRAAPLEIGERRQDEDPYAPLGLRVGSFTVTPTLEQGLGHTSNASSSPGGRSSVFSETGLRLRAASDWSRHAATVDADLDYRRSLSGAPLDELTGSGRATLRQDLPDSFAALYELGYRLAPEDADSPVDFDEAVSRPLRQTLDAAATVSRDAGKVRLSLRGGLLRETFQDARLASGERLSQRDRDSTLYSATLRTGYALSPALLPFVEAEIGRRIHDNRVDALGLERSANRLSLRGGLELDLSEKTRGELAAGWIGERPDDDRLASISAPYGAARIAWSPRRGTMVEIDGRTMVESAGAFTDDGSVFYSADLRLTHDILHNLTGNALFGIDWRDYAGSDEDETVMRAEAGLTWWLNRRLGINSRLRHVTLRSDRPGRGYSENSAYLGMIMQR